MVVGLDRNSATLMPYYIYIYTLVIPLRLAFPRHTLMFMIGRHELNRVLFLCVPQRERERERLIFKRGWKFDVPLPYFRRDKEGVSSFWHLPRSFQRNEPRGKWKSKTNGVGDNRPWKQYASSSFLLQASIVCSPSSSLLEEEEGRSVYSPSFSPVEILLYDAATTSAIRIFIRTTLKALTSDERGGRGVFNSAIGCFYARVRKLHLSFSIRSITFVWFVVFGSSTAGLFHGVTILIFPRWRGEDS